MSTFWSIWIIVITLGSIFGSMWLLFANRKTVVKGPKSESGDAPTTGHCYDGIEEYDNPLPAWWFWGFVATAVFGLIYLVLYPGLGAYQGALGWSSHGQHAEEVSIADEKMSEVYAGYLDTPVEQLAANPAALKMGRRIFNNNCSVCHGVGGVGANGFPNLTDSDWLYGGDPESIHLSILKGRQGAMPGWQSVLGDKGINEVTDYVLSLSGENHDASLAAAGDPQYKAFCAGCHGVEGKGMAALGAPNLTDNIWLYNQANLDLRANVVQTLRFGRNGNMPAQEGLLREEKIHLLTTYVYNLSRSQ